MAEFPEPDVTREDVLRARKKWREDAPPALRELVDAQEDNVNDDEV